MTPTQTLLEAVRAFLKEEVSPELDGITAYKQRIALNLLAMIERDLVGSPALNQLDQDYLTSSGLTPTDLAPAHSLATAIREGVLDVPSASGESTDRAQALNAYLRTRAMLSLAVDNPRYSGYRQARERWPELCADVDELMAQDRDAP